MTTPNGHSDASSTATDKGAQEKLMTQDGAAATAPSVEFKGTSSKLCCESIAFALYRFGQNPIPPLNVGDAQLSVGEQSSMLEI